MLRFRTGRKKETKEPESGTERMSAAASEQSLAKATEQPNVMAQSPVQPDEPAKEAPTPRAVDTELVAVIAAAIAAEEEIPVGSFVVRTIKRRA